MLKDSPDIALLYNRLGILSRRIKSGVPSVDGSTSYELFYPYGETGMGFPNLIPCYINYDTAIALLPSNYGVSPTDGIQITAFIPTLEQMGQPLDTWNYLMATYGFTLSVYPIGIDPTVHPTIQPEVYDMGGLIVPYEDHYELKVKKK
jgi:hypothetical protein